MKMVLCNFSFRSWSFMSHIIQIVYHRLALIKHLHVMKYAQLQALKMMTRWLLGVKSDANKSATSTLRLLYTLVLHEGDLMEKGRIKWDFCAISQLLIYDLLHLGAFCEWLVISCLFSKWIWNTCTCITLGNRSRINIVSFSKCKCFKNI